MLFRSVIIYDISLTDGINAPVAGQLTITVNETNLPPGLTLLGVGGSGPNYVIHATVGDTLSGITATGTDANASDTLTLTMNYEPGQSTLGNILTATPNPRIGVRPATALISGSVGTTTGTVVYRLTLSDGGHPSVWATLTVYVHSAFVNTPPSLQCYGVLGSAPNWIINLYKNESVSGVSARGTDIDSGDSLTLNVVRNAGQIGRAHV